MGNPVTVTTARGVVEYAATGEGPAVLALHGAMGGWDQSMLLARTVAPAGFRRLAVSRPGYLGTPLSAGPSPDEQADLYAAMLDTLGIERAGVIAVSGGGLSAVSFALRHARRCWALVLVSTVGEPMSGKVPLSFHLTMRLARWRWFGERMRRRVERDPAAAARRSIRDAAIRARTLDDPVAGPLFRELLVSTADRMAMRLDGTRHDVRASCRPTPPLECIDLPTLVVHGTDDPIVPFASHGAVLARRIPGAELLAIEGGEHVAIFTDCALVRARVEAFLRAHAPVVAVA